ncbi:hypothetical protein D9M73_77710 [compost metagenome]
MGGFDCAGKMKAIVFQIIAVVAFNKMGLANCSNLFIRQWSSNCSACAGIPMLDHFGLEPIKTVQCALIKDNASK